MVVGGQQPEFARGRELFRVRHVPCDSPMHQRARDRTAHGAARLGPAGKRWTRVQQVPLAEVGNDLAGGPQVNEDRLGSGDALDGLRVGNSDLGVRVPGIRSGRFCHEQRSRYTYKGRDKPCRPRQEGRAAKSLRPRGR